MSHPRRSAPRRSEPLSRRSLLARLGRLFGALAVMALVFSMPPAAGGESLDGKAGDKAFGDADAPIVMIEYYSLNCPYCAAFHRLVFPPLKAAYIETGKVRFVFRDFPLNWTALEAAILTHCAAPERYLALQNALFENARAWNGAEAPLQALAKIGAEHGVERATFKRCLEDGRLERQVLEAYEFASEELGVDSTPTFFIDGEKHVGGMAFETLSEKLDALLRAPE